MHEFYFEGNMCLTYLSSCQDKSSEQQDHSLFNEDLRKITFISK